MEVVLGGLIGVAFQKLYDSIVTAISTTSKIEFELKLLETKARILNRKLKEISNVLVDLESKFPVEISKLELLLEKARNLVSACSEVSRFNYFKKLKYMKRLAELDASFDEMLKVDFAAVELKVMLQVLVKVSEMNKKLDAMFGENYYHDVGKNDDYEMGIPVSTEDKGRRSSPRFQMSYFQRNERNFHLHLRFCSDDVIWDIA